jgi:2-keto-4-pentenoate hydratase/2-oxohepta-3-ene-1,7-dioic acid hydratase in catechol pathway
MKVGRVDKGGGPETAIVHDDSVRVLPGVSVVELLAADARERDRLVSLSRAEFGLSEVRLLSPIEPASIRDFSVFEQHVEGASMFLGGPDAKVPDAWYDRPAFYFSNPHATSGPGDQIEPPPGHSGLDLELELAAIIIRRGRNIPVGDAAGYIGGYTIFNDWSERHLSAREAALPFGFHKAKDFANTFGPWIVTPDELVRYRDGDRLNLTASAYINEVELGSDTFASMAWSFEELVHFASLSAWIGPGDVLGSGTCGGGCLFELWGRNQAQSPPPLITGDEVRLEVEGIGTLISTIGEPQPDLPALPRARGRLAA